MQRETEVKEREMKRNFEELLKSGMEKVGEVVEKREEEDIRENEMVFLDNNAKRN